MKRKEKMAHSRKTEVYEPSEKSLSQKQMDQREKFSLKMDFFTLINPIINMGFGHFKQVSPLNAALKKNKKIITGTSANFSIDYAKVLISKGRLNNPMLVDSYYDEEDRLIIDWSYDPATEDATDRCNILIYSELLNSYFSMEGVLRREDMGIMMYKNAQVGSGILHAWMFFISQDGSEVSDSIYLGSSK